MRPKTGLIKWSQFSDLQHYLGVEDLVLRLVDLGVVNIVDLLDGPQTLYAPVAGQYADVFASPEDLVVPDSGQIAVGIGITLEELLVEYFYLKYNMTDFTSFLSVNGPKTRSGLVSGNVIKAVYETHLNALNLLTTPSVAWQANHAYSADFLLLLNGHYWSANAYGADGTSDSMPPDFAGNVGGTVVDNDITWTDEGAIPTQGSIHIYALVS